MLAILEHHIHMMFVCEISVHLDDVFVMQPTVDFDLSLHSAVQHHGGDFVLRNYFYGELLLRLPFDGLIDLSELA